MKSRIWIVMVLFVFVGSVVAQDSIEIDVWECPRGFAGQTLDVYNWSTYIADNTIEDFEDACDIDVIYTLFDSDDEILEVLRAGNAPRFDVVVPGGTILSELISEDLVMPLNKDAIPNIATISEELLNPPFDSDNIYSVPYQWGTVAVGYNTNVFPDGISSWEDVWSYQGATGWLNDARSMMGLAALTLGYDPNTSNVAEIIEIRDFLGSSAGENVTIYPDSVGQDVLANGDVDIIIEYSGDIIDLTYDCECDDFGYIIPEEGANIWIDNMAIPATADNPELANVFIDYISHPLVNADISNFTAYGSPNQVAIDNDLIDADLLEDTGIYPSDEVREGLFFLEDLGTDINDIYRQAWEELLNFFGSD